jgi:hypothetical protein
MFSIQLANRALPLVRRIVEDIADAHRRWRGLVAEYESASILSTAERPDARALELERETQRLAADIDGFIGELARIGVVFQGHDLGRVVLQGHDLGFVDFPGELDGRPVHFCWRLGETSVRFWHELDEGSAGRRPLDEAAPESPSPIPVPR